MAEMQAQLDWIQGRPQIFSRTGVDVFGTHIRCQTMTHLTHHDAFYKESLYARAR